MTSWKFATSSLIAFICLLPITHIITNWGYLSFYICINYTNAHLKILGMPSFLQLGYMELPLLQMLERRLQKSSIVSVSRRRLSYSMAKEMSLSLKGSFQNRNAVNPSTTITSLTRMQSACFSYYVTMRISMATASLTRTICYNAMSF